jgi:pyridinium-3,5-bisthiocarboxylic acid mononucleotide nickel chelatase
VRAPITGWLDCSAGVSGDMLLAAVVDAGAEVGAAIGALGLQTTVHFTAENRGALRAMRAHVSVDHDQSMRTLPDIEAVLARASLPDVVVSRARAVFGRLARAEARVHGIAVDDVHFHEIGAVDTMVDVVGVCFGLHTLGVESLTASTLSLGSGAMTTAHGKIPLPGPAALELARDSALVVDGSGVAESATPTGVALLAEWVDATQPLPLMRVQSVGIGAGSRADGDRPNVVRLVVGTAADGTPDAGWSLIEANIDDLDPRLWPEVIARLLDTGAADAWLTPIVMKKGRPAHTLSVLTSPERAADVRDAMFRETSTIGVRTTAVGKSALDRDWVSVDVAGAPVRVKVARLDGTIVNAVPEWEDVVAAARSLQRPAKAVLAAAIAAAQLVTA